MEDKKLQKRVRNSYFVSTVSIAMVLFLLGATTYLIINVLSATDRLRESVVIHVIVRDGLSDEKTSELRKSLEDQLITRDVKYIPKAEAAEKFIAESGEDFRTFLGEDPAANPLPNSFEVGLAAKGSDRDEIEAFITDIEALNGVDEVVYSRGVVEQIGANLSKFNLILALFGTALLVISLVLLHNTIRMTIIAKRRIINTMRLVGANESFIMRQFAGSALMHGLWAGGLATLIFAILVSGLRRGMPELSLVGGGWLVVGIALGMIVLGVAISLIFTVLSVFRAVREDSSRAMI